MTVPGTASTRPLGAAKELIEKCEGWKPPAVDGVAVKVGLGVATIVGRGDAAKVLSKNWYSGAKLDGTVFGGVTIDSFLSGVCVS